jgi:hypothetical protein
MEVADPTTDEKNGQAKIASSASQDVVVINSKKKREARLARLQTSRSLQI